MDTYGTSDELNAVLGTVSSELQTIKVLWAQKLLETVELIQHDLFSIGSYLSNFDNTWLLESLPEHTAEFEKEIDEMTEKMPALANFILPSGGKVGASFHHARTVSRRAERRIVTLSKTQKIDESVVKYINRLSDLFFTMARFANFKQKRKEIIWVSK